MLNTLNLVPFYTVPGIRNSEFGFSVSAGLQMLLFLTGAVLLAVILSLFWMIDRLEGSLFARFVYSGLVARLAVLGAVFIVLGILMMFSS